MLTFQGDKYWRTQDIAKQKKVTTKFKFFVLYFQIKKLDAYAMWCGISDIDRSCNWILQKKTLQNCNTNSICIFGFWLHYFRDCWQEVCRRKRRLQMDLVFCINSWKVIEFSFDVKIATNIFALVLPRIIRLFWHFEKKL